VGKFLKNEKMNWTLNKWLNKDGKEKVHPKVEKSISPAFKVDGEQYYEFDNLSDCPAGRYFRIQQFMVELNLRIDKDSLVELLDKALEFMDKNQATKTAAILLDIKNRTEFLIETNTAYRLASAVFFTLDEDLTTYDFDYNQKKIEKFKKQDISTFFLSRPMKKLIPQINISGADLAIYLKATEAQKTYEHKLMHGK
jgi:hypothetical protein